MESPIFSSEHAAKGLNSQMDSLGRDVSRYFREGTLAVYPVEKSNRGGNSDSAQDPERSLALLAMDMERLPAQYKIVIVDSITQLVSQSQETAIMGFFSSCKRMCVTREGRTLWWGVLIPSTRRCSTDLRSFATRTSA